MTSYVVQNSRVCVLWLEDVLEFAGLVAEVLRQALIHLVSLGAG